MVPAISDGSQSALAHGFSCGHGDCAGLGSVASGVRHFMCNDQMRPPRKLPTNKNVRYWLGCLALLISEPVQQRDVRITARRLKWKEKLLSSPVPAGVWAEALRERSGPAGSRSM